MLFVIMLTFFAIVMNSIYYRILSLDMLINQVFMWNVDLDGIVMDYLW